MARTRHSGSVVLLVAAALLATAVSARAQSDTGTIDGRVFDQTKAAVPGVTVTARNVSTGFTRSAVSSELGTYRIEFLPPGRYEVRAELANFAPAMVENRYGRIIGITSVVGVTAMRSTRMAGRNPNTEKKAEENKAKSSASSHGPRAQSVVRISVKSEAEGVGGNGKCRVPCPSKAA